MKKIRNLLITMTIILAIPLLALSQGQPSPSQAQSNSHKEDGIGLAPARLELPMLPGSERTVVVNVIYNSASGEAEPCRLVASLGDWGILNDGNVEYYKAGTQPNSASSWIVYSPGEVKVLPGKIHPIRVTISVPKDATPGDHLAALFVESRSDNIKPDQNRRQVILRFRMAALFYIMVPQLTKKGSLQSLIAKPDQGSILVTPTLKNEGNSFIRPIHSIKVFDSKGVLVAELDEKESLPVLAGSELSLPLLVEKTLPPGLYSVRYRVDFKDGGSVTEGQTDLLVKDHLAQKPMAIEGGSEQKAKVVKGETK